MSRDLIRLMHSLFLPVADVLREAAWRPAADVCRLPGGWLLKFELAGVRPEDIQVLVRGNRLTLRGQRRGCMEEGACTYYRMEIAYGYFERSVELPRDLESAEIGTEYRDGMLLVRIRTEEATHER